MWSPSMATVSPVGVRLPGGSISHRTTYVPPSGCGSRPWISKVTWSPAMIRSSDEISSMFIFLSSGNSDERGGRANGFAAGGGQDASAGPEQGPARRGLQRPEVDELTEFPVFLFRGQPAGDPG